MDGMYYRTAFAICLEGRRYGVGNPISNSPVVSGARVRGLGATKREAGHLRKAHFMVWTIPIGTGLVNRTNQ